MACRAWSALLRGVLDSGDVEYSLYCHRGVGFEEVNSPLDCALIRGRLPLLRFVSERLGWDPSRREGLPRDLAVSLAARSGSIECLEYLHDAWGCAWHPQCCVEVASRGDVGLLGSLNERGCPWDECALDAAANHGHVECVRLLIKRGLHPGPRTCSLAAASGHLDVLECCISAATSWCPEDVLREAAKSGSVEVLIYLRNCDGIEFNKWTCASIAFGGNLDALKLVHSEWGVPWDEGTCIDAARNGHPECLKFAHENGCPWPASRMCETCVRSGSEECRRYCLENGCSVPESCVSEEPEYSLEWCRDPA